MIKHIDLKISNFLNHLHEKNMYKSVYPLEPTYRRDGGIFFSLILGYFSIKMIILKKKINILFYGRGYFHRLFKF